MEHCSKESLKVDLIHDLEAHEFACYCNVAENIEYECQRLPVMTAYGHTGHVTQDGWQTAEVRLAIGTWQLNLLHQVLDDSVRATGEVDECPDYL